MKLTASIFAAMTFGSCVSAGDCIAQAGPGGAATSGLCAFSSGAYAGKTLDYTGLAALPVGSSCQDGQGGNGVIVSTPVGPKLSGFSTICKFTVGPRAGTTLDYAPMKAIPVGTGCQDGGPSSGVVIADDGTPHPKATGAVPPAAPAPAAPKP